MDQFTYSNHHHCYSLWLRDYGRKILNHLLAELKKGNTISKSGSQKNSSKPTSATRFLCDLADQFSGKKGMTTIPLFSGASSDKALKKKPLWTTSFPQGLPRAHTTLSASGCHCNASQAPPWPEEIFQSKLSLQDQRQRLNCKSIIEKTSLL